MTGTASGISVTVVEIDSPMMMATEAAIIICIAEPGCLSDATNRCVKVRFGSVGSSSRGTLCCTSCSSVALDMVVL